MAKKTSKKTARGGDRSVSGRADRPGGQSRKIVMPEGAGVPFAPPVELRGTGSKSVYNDVCAVLAREGREMVEGDALHVALLANAVALYGQAQRELWAHVKEHGTLTMEGAKGGLVQHPSAVIMRQWLAEIGRLCRELGLGPAAREALKLGGDQSNKKEPEDGLGSFQRSRGDVAGRINKHAG